MAHANLYSLIKIPEDYQFLQDHQNATKMITVGKTIEFKIKEDKKQKHIEIQRQARAKQRQEISMTSSSLKTCDEDDDQSIEDTNNESDEELYTSITISNALQDIKLQLNLN